MFRRFSKVLFIISILSFNLYSENIFDDFVNIYNRGGKSYKLSGTFTDIKDGKKTINNFDMIIGKDYKLMYLKDNKTLFLANNQYFTEFVVWALANCYMSTYFCWLSTSP